MWQLLGAAAGTVLNAAGEQAAANAMAKQSARELKAENALAQRRRDSVRQELSQVDPAAVQANAVREHNAVQGDQQSQLAAIQQAYGLDNPTLSDQLATTGTLANDAAWGRAYGLADSQRRGAIIDNAGRQDAIDSDQWWLERFAPNRMQRAGDTGKTARMIGTLLGGASLGAANMAMARPQNPAIAGQFGSNAVNAQTGANMTSDLGNRDWLGLGGRG